MENQTNWATIVGCIIGLSLVIFSLVTSWQAGVWWVTIHLFLVWVLGLLNIAIIRRQKKEIEELKARLGD